ncbi:MAG: glycoside hydrolase family 127 protein, partial [Verrucomicrobia bacterium]|nr:glycoside hydrolase family 127 protein [Verrucomicrobiota bacterium]
RPQFGSVSWIKKDSHLAAGEMGGNWLDGFIRMAYLSGVPSAKKQADDFVRDLLAARDSDGYIGNYPAAKRYQNRITCEFWMQSRIYVALLAYYELTGDKKILDAVIKATQITMSQYGPANSPFHLTDAERGMQKKGRDRTVNGHALMFVDVLEWLHRLTGDRAYVDFAAFLYEDFSSSGDVEEMDLQLPHVLNEKYPYFWHAVHTVENLRVPLFLAYADGRKPYPQAAANAFAKVQKHITPAGSCAGDEGVMNHLPLASQPYEYCTTTELATSLESALQKTGQSKYADLTERAVFNAAQGARFPDGKCIAYLSSATLPEAVEDFDIPYAGKKRHKYSPAHDVGGACCSANSVKILPYYTSAMWMKTAKDDGLAALLFGPCSVKTTIKGVPITIEERTTYPFSDIITLTVTAASPVNFPITIRVPGWSSRANISAPGATITDGDGVRTVTKTWQTGDKITVAFDNPIIAAAQPAGDACVFRGPLLYVQSWPGKLVPLTVQEFSVPGFQEYNVIPNTAYNISGLYLDTAKKDCGFALKRDPKGNELNPWAEPPLTLVGEMHTYNRNEDFHKETKLVPMGSTLLRFASFRVWPFDDDYFKNVK